MVLRLWKRDTSSATGPLSGPGLGVAFVAEWVVARLFGSDDGFDDAAEPEDTRARDTIRGAFRGASARRKARRARQALRTRGDDHKGGPP